MIEVSKGGLREWGFAPGKRVVRCRTCERQFRGDRIAVRCSACATFARDVKAKAVAESRGVQA